jgi:hypothetical protein
MMSQVKISLTVVNRNGAKARLREYLPPKWEIDRW